MSDSNALRNEIVNDPLGRGYSGMTDEQVLTSLTTADRPKNKERMTGEEISEAIVKSEYDALSDAAKDRVIAYVNLRSIDPFGFAQTVFLDIFGGGSQTITNLAAVRVDQVTRASQIGWNSINIGDVKAARA